MSPMKAIHTLTVLTALLCAGPAAAAHLDPGIRREIVRTADSLIRDARHSQSTFWSMCGSCRVGVEAGRLAALARTVRETAVRDGCPFAVVGDFERVERQFGLLKRSFREATYIRDFPNVRFEWRMLEQSYRDLKGAVRRISGGKDLMDLYGDQ